MRVGHDDDRAVAQLDLGGAYVDPADVAFDPADADQVANLDRALGEQDQAGDEVLDDFLQAEADPHRQGTDDPGQVGPFHPQRRQGQEDHQGIADVGEQGAERGAHARVHVGLGQELVVQPAAQGADQVNAQYQGQYGIEQVPGDDVELTQTGAAEKRDDVADQLPQSGADAADEQGDDRQQQQPGAAEAGDQRFDLVQAPVTDAQQLFERLAAGLAGREHILAAVLEHLHQQVETGQQDKHPDHLIGDEARQRHIAGEQGNHRGDHGDAGNGVDQPGHGRRGFRRVPGGGHRPAGSAGAHQQGDDEAGDHQRGNASASDDQLVAHAGGIGDLHQGHQHQQGTGQPAGIRLQCQGHRIGDIRQAPGRMLGRQQRPAQPGNQHTGVGKFLELLGEGRQHRRQRQVTGTGVKQQLQGNAGGQQGRQHRGQGQ
ncbi:hypothetical protein D3C81_832800 [compost metagenome]